MRAPLSWLREYVDLPADLTARALGEAFVPLGMEVAVTEELGADVTGPLVLGVVREIEELTEFKKPIRWVRVDVGPQNVDGSAGMPGVAADMESRGVVCGARNFAAGDLVVVALPGAVLSGGFAIGARKTYGRASDGMICSVRELGIGDDHTGILVLPPDAGAPGDDASGLLGLRDGVVDMEVTADRGDRESVRGLARDASYAFGGAYRDPAEQVTGPEPETGGRPVRIETPDGCRRFSALVVRGLDPRRETPLWMRTRLYRAGFRSVSLAVDVTNYVMAELGQPLHAFDAARLSGDVVARRARHGEQLTTIDHARRALDPDDMVVADDSGAVAVAGVMGGVDTEVSGETTDLLLEAACWDPPSISRAVRRHKLPSEASRRFERGVDPEVAVPALRRAAELLVTYGGATVGGLTVAGEPYEPASVELPPDLPARTIGLPVEPAEVVRQLSRIGCAVTAGDPLSVSPPSWRPDLRDPADLVEEVARLEGYARVPSVVPAAPAGRGLTDRQRLRRRVGCALAYTGYVEALNAPFVAAEDWDALGLPADDGRRAALRLANPLSEEQPLLRTTLLPGLLRTLRRNVGRGLLDVALFETALVFRPRPDAPRSVPRPSVDALPAEDGLALVESVLPAQPEHVGVALCGVREPAGWWGRGRPAGWADAVEAMRVAAAQAGVHLEVRQAATPPWHPGRCAELRAGKDVVGYAGELHPRVVAALGLPERTCAGELDLSALPLEDVPPVAAPRISTYPPALVDVALVVADSVPAGEVERALRDGAGELLEAVRLFDVYTGAQVAEGRRSLAYALRLRAPDRTLTTEEVAAARDAAVAEAARRTGAVMRGG